MWVYGKMKYNATLSGCPQGGILSPLLSNLYMDKFDQFMEKHILPVYNCGGRRTENKTYKALSKQIQKHMRHKNWKTVKELNKQRQSMPSKDVFDPTFRRLYYIRYADDWLLGVSGPMQDAIKVKEQIRTFLVSELKLTLSEEKTLITHAKTEKARFLGYDIHVLHHDAKHDKRGQRSINGVIGFRVPDEKMKTKARQYKKSGKPTHRKDGRSTPILILLPNTSPNFVDSLNTICLPIMLISCMVSREQWNCLWHVPLRISSKRRSTKSSSCTKRLVKRTDKVTRYFKRK